MIYKSCNFDIVHLFLKKSNSRILSPKDPFLHFNDIETSVLARTIIPVPMSVFPNPAKRPLFSAMTNQKLQKDIGYSIPNWRDAVDRFINEYPMQ